MKRLRVAVSCALLAALVGCSNGQVKPENYSGFIGDYSTLAPATAPSGAPLLRWVDPQADVRRYQRIYIEPSRFYPVPKPNDKVSAKTLADITTYYDQALRRELGKSLPLASAPGPGILVLKPAITAVSSHTQGLRPYEVIPIALIAAGMSTAVGIRDQDTQIATEAMLLDGGNTRYWRRWCARAPARRWTIPISRSRETMSRRCWTVGRPTCACRTRRLSVLVDDGRRGTG